MMILYKTTKPPPLFRCCNTSSQWSFLFINSLRYVQLFVKLDEVGLYMLVCNCVLPPPPGRFV